MSQGPYAQDPLFYLGTAIPDPHAPVAAHGVQKLPGYDPTTDFNAVMRATRGGVSDEKLSAFLPCLVPIILHLSTYDRVVYG